MGVNAPCVIGHGISDSKAVKNALIVAAKYADNNMKVNKEIEEEISKFDIG